MFSASLKGVWSTWTSAAGKTYAVDWDNIFRVFGNNVTSDPNWIIKAMDAGFAMGGPRVQVDTVPAMVTNSTPSSPVATPPTVQTIVTQQTIPSGTFTTTQLPTRTITTVAPTSTVTPADQGTNVPGRWTVYTNAQPTAPAQPQGIPMSEFNFSTLPQVRAHAQLGRLGDPSGCSIWNPTTYGTCSTWIIQARTELANMQNALIDLTNRWDAGIADIQSWPDSQEKADQLSAAQQGRAAAYSLVQQHSVAQGDFEEKVQPFVNIGLGGLWKSSGGTAGLGVLPFGVWAIVSTGSLAIAALLAWQIVNALAIKEGYAQNTAFYNSQAQYNSQCSQLLMAGRSCSSLINPGSNAPGSPIGANVMMIAGLAGLVLLIMAMRKF